MKFNKKDVTYKYTKGTGPGGQRKNKVLTCVVATHEPTGLTVKIDGRKQGQNKRVALKELEKLVISSHQAELAADKKERRDDKIKNGKTIRTYNYNKQLVKDHRSKKVYDLKKFLEGKADLNDFSTKDDGDGN